MYLDLELQWIILGVGGGHKMEETRRDDFIKLAECSQKTLDT